MESVWLHHPSSLSEKHCNEDKKEKELAKPHLKSEDSAIPNGFAKLCPKQGKIVSLLIKYALQ